MNIGIFIRNKRLLKTNDIFKFYYKLFNYFDENGNGIIHISNQSQISQFLLSSNIDKDTLNHIQIVIIGQNNNCINLFQFISLMNLIYIVQNNYYIKKQLPQNYDLLLNDMKLDSFYNSKQVKIPTMSYPNNNNNNNNDIGNMVNIPLSITPLTPSPPLSSSFNPNIQHNITPIFNPISPSADEGKSEFMIDDNKSTAMKPIIEPIAINNDEINMKQFEFKRFFDLNMSCPKKDIYYNSFIECGYNDIDILLHLDLDTLINECKIDKVYAKFFMSKITDFIASHQRFKKFIIEELEMEEYWTCFCNQGIVSFSIFYLRITDYDDITNIINDQHDAKIIYYKLPKNLRRNITDNDNASSPPNKNRKLTDHPGTPYI